MQRRSHVINLFIRVKSCNMHSISTDNGKNKMWENFLMRWSGLRNNMMTGGGVLRDSLVFQKRRPYSTGNRRMRRRGRD